ncbi:exosome complex component RRP45-like isoform X2 [Liolophura sinensis]|uniref:exosome complex component RRP45-like isoform X2 n=1 Tax=Liolophura sinensis TaxID=3198878 RepID=UPI0031588267
MREIPLSSCERDFILKTIAEKQRLDGRQPYDYRKMKISFGLDRGCSQVEIGDTRCLAQVSGEITAPKQTRPTDGILFTNVELSPMACPSFEPGRLSDFGVELNRLLERCLKESRCIDTESLCIVAGEKVWTIRVDVHVLNHEGNLLDCVSVAAITALAHFRRPDVTVNGDEVTVHPVEEKNPVPLSVLHMPLTVTFGFFEQGRYLLVDPLRKEELVMDGQMVIGMNKHREICTLQMTGDMLLLKDQVLRCSNIAVVKVTEITELIQKALKSDAAKRSTGDKVGFTELYEAVKITSNAKEEEDVDISDVKDAAMEVVRQGKELTKEDAKLNQKTAVKVVAPGTGQIGEGGPNSWLLDEDLEKDLEQEEAILQKKGDNSATKSIPIAPAGGDMDDDSEEEPVVLNNEDLYVQRREMKIETPDESSVKKTSQGAKATSPAPKAKKKKKRKS